MGRITLPPIEEARKSSQLPAEWLDPLRRKIEEEVGKAILDHRMSCEVVLADVREAERVLKKLVHEIQFGDKENPGPTGYTVSAAADHVPNTTPDVATPRGAVELATVRLMVSWAKQSKKDVETTAEQPASSN